MDMCSAIVPICAKRAGQSIWCCNGITTHSAGPQTHKHWKPQCLRSPFLHLLFLHTLVPSSSPSLLLRSPRLPSISPPSRSTSFFTSFLNPLSSSWIPPFPAYPTFSSPSPTPLAHPHSRPPFPNQSVCVQLPSRSLPILPVLVRSPSPSGEHDKERSSVFKQTHCFQMPNGRVDLGAALSKIFKFSAFLFLRICMDMHSFAMCKGTRTAEPWFK